MARPPRSSSSSSSPANKFEVFDFKEEDEHVEKASMRILGKFSNPSVSHSSPIAKYDFLRAFAHYSNTVSKDVPTEPIVLSESDEDDTCLPENFSDEPLEVDHDDYGDGGTCTGTVMNDQGACANSCSNDMAVRDSADKVITGFSGFVEVESDFELKNQSLDIMSDDDDSGHISSSSTSTPNPTEVGEFLEDQLVAHGSTTFEIDGIKRVIDVFPDYIQYEDLYSTSSRLIFSCSSLKVEGSKMNGTGGTFKFRWATEDIIKIESRWLGKVETAMINLFLQSKDSREAGNTNQNPGFRMLKFAIYDPCWSKTEMAIKLLDMRYMDIWSTILDDMDNNENIWGLEQDSLFSHKPYLPIFGKEFDEVIYPKGEPDAVSIMRSDVELLEPGSYINDTIIDFYIKYLKNKIPPDEQDRFHFFNSFFFRKLADLDKDPSSARDGRAAFQRVRKWTRKVNLFEKDYILIPINYNVHWSLIIICHPGEVINFKDDEIKESSKVPCVLHMDSLKGSHKGLQNVFQSYLGEEWKERHGDVAEDVFTKFLHMRFVSLELPQQENFYDCGLFLLHYVERFLEEAPINFNPFKITKFSNFLNSNWFPPPEPSLKRSHIQNLIYDIFNKNSLKAPTADCPGKPPSEIPGIVEHKLEADSLVGSCYSAVWHDKNPSSSSIEQGTDILFPEASPIRVASCLREPELFFKDLGGIVVNSHFPLCRQTTTYHRRGLMSPIEETEEFDEGTTLSVIVENSQVAALAPDIPSTSYVSEERKALDGFTVNLAEAVEDNSYSRTSSVFCNTLMIGAHEDQLLKKTAGSNIPDKTYGLEYLSTFGEELANYVVEESEESNDEQDVDVSVMSRSSFPGNVMDSVTHQFFDLTQNMSLGNDALVSKKVPRPSESYEREAKRPKLVNPGGQRRLFTRSVLNAL